MIWTILLVLVTLFLIVLNHIYSNVDSGEFLGREKSGKQNPVRADWHA